MKVIVKLIILLSYAIVGGMVTEDRSYNQEIKTSIANGKVSEILTRNESIELLDPKVDFIFKKIFGTEENKSVLMSFLNALFKDNPKITSLTLGNVELPKELLEDKASRLDIRATCNDNTEVDIEMQCKNTGEIPERAFYYLSKITAESVKTTEAYNKTKVISIWIFRDSITNRKNAISEAYMTFEEYLGDPYERLTDKGRIIFIELEKFNIASIDTNDMLDGWLSFLINPLSVNAEFFEDKNMKQALETLKTISSDKKTRATYNARKDAIIDFNSSIVTAENKGRAEGLVEGEKIGGDKKAIEVAKNLLLMGLSIEQISQGTGLPIKEIEKLK